MNLCCCVIAKSVFSLHPHADIAVTCNFISNSSMRFIFILREIVPSVVFCKANRTEAALFVYFYSHTHCLWLIRLIAANVLVSAYYSFSKWEILIWAEVYRENILTQSIILALHITKSLVECVNQEASNWCMIWPHNMAVRYGNMVACY